MSDRLKAAVSGLRHGKSHCNAYREHPDCDLVALFDPNPERAQERLQENPGAKVYASFEEMLERAKPDLVSVSSPEFAHAEQTVKAMEAGCHVLVEKAMSDSLEGLEQMLEATERTGKLLYVGQEVRLTPAFLDAKRLIAEAQLGTVYQAESNYIHNCEHLCSNGQWRGNPDLAHHAMISGGCHPVDLLRSLLGEVSEVFAWHTHLNKETVPYPDCITATLKFDEGTVATVVVSISTRRSYELKLNLNGTEGYFAGSNSGSSSKVWLAPPLEHAEEAVEVPSFQSNHDCASQVKNLVNGILNNTPLMVDAWEGANSASICFAAVESAKKGSPVKPKRFKRPSSVQPPADVLEVMAWRRSEEILSNRKGAGR